MNYSIKSTLLVSLMLCGAIIGVHAQDTSKKKSIDITSTFKPVLREAAKINFNAAPPQTDSNKTALKYSVPNQQLSFNYQPAELKPVALAVDTSNKWESSNFIKVGVGNVHLPFVKAGFSFGDGVRSNYNLFAQHYNSKGSLPFQKHSLTSVGAEASYMNLKHREWSGNLGFASDNYYLYGYRPTTLVFTKDQLKQRFQTISGKVVFRNTIPTEYGLNYRPSLSVNVFNDQHSLKANESNTVLDLPLEKTFGQSFAFDLGATADLTSYTKKTVSGKTTVQNNLFYISPAVIFKTPNVFVHAGIRPSWDNKVFTMLPNVMADFSTTDQRFVFQLGWIGYYNKGSYQRFYGINPWLAQPDSLLNTRVQERYAGFKGTIKNFTYSAKVGFQQYRNMPLFVNDAVDGKTFVVRYESKMEVLQLHGEVGYTHGEQFSVTSSLNFNQFTKLQKEANAWGMLPIEFNTNLRWQLMKDLWLKTDVFMFNGARYRAANGDSFKGDGAVDLNLGSEFRITKNFNLWVQFNNVFNNKYERWNQYEAYGFNFLGGITYSFNQKPVKK